MQAKTIIKPLNTIPIIGRENEYLRLVSENDLDDYYALIDAERKHLETFQKWAIDSTYENTREHIQQSIKAVSEGKALQYRILLKNNRMVGGIGLRDYDIKSKSCYLGYWIAKEFEGIGLMYDSCHSLINYSFEYWNLNKIILEISPENIRSQHLAKRLGAHPTGIFTDGPFPDYPTKNEIWEITNV